MVFKNVILFSAGEFEFRCNKCRKTIFQDLHKACKSIGNERINGPYEFIDNVLYGFLCRRPNCNYVQLSKDNLVAHLQNEHQIIADDKDIIEITLLKCVQTITSLCEEEQHTDDEAVKIIDDDEDFEMSISNRAVDLTLSDDDMLITVKSDEIMSPAWSPVRKENAIHSPILIADTSASLHRPKSTKTCSISSKSKSTKSKSASEAHRRSPMSTKRKTSETPSTFKIPKIKKPKIAGERGCEIKYQ